MATPLIEGTNSFVTALDADTIAYKFFLHPQYDQFLTLANDDPTYQKSHLLINATRAVNHYLRALGLDGSKATGQKLEFPRDGNIPDEIKEATVIQAMHLLEFSPKAGGKQYTNSTTLGKISTSIDSNGVRAAIAGICTDAKQIILECDQVIPIAYMRTTRV